MRLILKFAGFALSLAVLLAAAGVVWGHKAFTAPGPLAQDAFFVVDKGEPLGRIAAALSQAGALEHPLVFRAAARIAGAQGSLKAGEYLLSAGSSARDLLELLRSGKTYRRAVTIPEGLTAFEVMEKVNAAELMEGSIPGPPEEGSLLPETYDYARGDRREAMIGRMREAMDKTLAELWEGREPGLPFSNPREALILASIVEKETGVASERARIAGVFINRLRQGMPLQSDPTVIYALNGGRNRDGGMGPLGRRLLLKDLETESPYNTYRHAGLPPGPIANPGREAIAAVLHPEHNDYLYFVADGTGGHVFAATLEEHNRNVAAWRVKRGEPAAPEAAAEAPASPKAQSLIPEAPKTKAPKAGESGPQKP